MTDWKNAPAAMLAKKAQQDALLASAPVPPNPRNQQTSALARRAASELLGLAHRHGLKELVDLAVELQVRAQRIEVERESAEKTVAALDASKVEKVLAHARLDTVKYIDDAPREKADAG